jgi:sporulation protein YlmC with PRC-barrel domain
MRKLLISAVSLAALTMGGFAFAQDTTGATSPPQPTTDQKAAQPGTDQSTTTMMPKKTDENAAATQQPSTEQPTANQSTAEKTTTQPAPSTAVVVSGLDANNVFLASKFIGSTVYSSANENVGDINDMVIGKDGKVQAVIIGVGGFLGLGEKDVAVPMDRIQFARDENNNMKFTITASRQELEQAPAFDRSKLIVGGYKTVF